MNQVGLRELGQNPSQVLRRVAAGEVLTVTDRLRPVARLVPWEESAVSRLQSEGKVRVAKTTWGVVPKPLPVMDGLSASATLADLREVERY